MTIFNIKYFPKHKTPTLFKYRYLVLDKHNKTQIDFSKIDTYLGEYTIEISNDVIEKYSNTEYKDILVEYQSGKHTLNLLNPKYKDGKYLRCLLENETTSLFKKLFLSTLVYDNESLKCPKEEFIEISFDVDKKIATIFNLELYIPENNPYYNYAQKAAVHTSVESIGLCNYINKEVKDFYKTSNIGEWKRAELLKKEKSITDASGIYMLYDDKTNQLYIGKAIRIKERIIQHQKSDVDCMRNFTHYRYSVVADEYFEFLYLIENAAIHDIAQILEMPQAKTYKKPLVKITKDISNCKITNKHEHQTKKQS